MIFFKVAGSLNLSWLPTASIATMIGGDILPRPACALEMSSSHQSSGGSVSQKKPRRRAFAPKVRTGCLTWSVLLPMPASTSNRRLWRCLLSDQFIEPLLILRSKSVSSLTPTVGNRSCKPGRKAGSIGSEPSMLHESRLTSRMQNPPEEMRRREARL
jgi:hypothetical protein